MPHKELTSKADFDTAIAEQGKYVLILAYSGTVHPKAEEAAEKFASTTSSYKVDLSKQEAAGKGLGLTAADTPAVVIFKDGKNVKTLKGINADTGAEIAATLGA